MFHFSGPRHSLKKSYLLVLSSVLLAASFAIGWNPEFSKRFDKTSTYVHQLRSWVGADTRLSSTAAPLLSMIPVLMSGLQYYLNVAPSKIKYVKYQKIVVDKRKKI